MTVEWKPAEVELVGVHFEILAELNGARLVTYMCDTEEEGPHIVWMVYRPDGEMRVSGTVRCARKQFSQASSLEEALQPAFELAKKRAEAFAMCWVKE